MTLMGFDFIITFSCRKCSCLLIPDDIEPFSRNFEERTFIITMKINRRNNNKVSSLFKINWN